MSARRLRPGHHQRCGHFATSACQAGARLVVAQAARTRTHTHTHTLVLGCEVTKSNQFGCSTSQLLKMPDVSCVQHLSFTPFSIFLIHSLCLIKNTENDIQNALQPDARAPSFAGLLSTLATC